MIRWARDFRLIPVVLLAAVSLFTLKVSGLVLDGGYTLGDRLAGRNKTDLKETTADSVPEFPSIVFADAEKAKPKSWAQEVFNYGDVTGSVGGGDKKDAKPAEGALKTTDKPPETPKLVVGTQPVPLEQGKINSAGERAVLERLQERREELNTRNRDLDMRESLVKAAEKRLEARVMELKDLETRVNNTIQTRDKAEADRFKSIVTMYENMKPKDAARIFDRLDLKILMDVSSQMNPRKMSDILAQMSSESAERLTVEMAAKANSAKGRDQLPKIEGKPGGN